MGTYTIVDVELTLKIPVNEFEIIFEAEKKKQKKIKEFWECHDLTWDANGELMFIDEYRKYYDGDEVDTFLAPYVKKGSINCRDDYNETWRTYFDGEGNSKIQDSTTIYDHNPYKEFMDAYKDELPKELIQKLEEWRMAKEL